MANLTAGKGLSFKVGTQAKVNSMITSPSTYPAVPGAFYLAEDTHRLYIGNDDFTLSPLNEGVTTVATVENLPSLTSGNAAAYQGQFYYCSTPNILCVCSGERWVQINPDTYLYHNETDTSVASTTDSNGYGIATVSHEIKDAGGTTVHKSKGNFQIKGSKNVTLTTDTTNRVIQISVPDGATYSLTAAQNGGNQVDLTLTGSNGDSDTIPFVKGSGGVYPTYSNGQIKLDGGGLTGNASFALTETNGALKIKLTDAGSNSKEINFTPKIKIGQTEQEVLFSLDNSNNLVADLNVYTISEVDDKITSELRNFEGMYFAGTIGTGGTVASLTALAAATNLHSGATFKFTEAIPSNSSLSIDGWDSDGAQIGDMLIVTGQEYQNTDSTNTTTYTTDASKVGTLATKTYTYIPSGDDADIYYTPNFATNKTLSFTKSGANGAVHKAIFAASTANDAGVTVSASTTNGTNGGKNQTITIGHKAITTTHTEATAVSDITESSYTAVTGVTTDKGGHLTGYTTTQLNLNHNKLEKAVTYSQILTPAAGSTTTTLRIGRAYLDSKSNQLNPAASGTIKNNFLDISSDTLDLSVTAAGSSSASNPAASGSTVATSSVKIDMVWGSF